MTNDTARLPPDPDDAARARPRKSAEAYRTISEVADELHVPQHVLRFWETKFPRIKPLKRGGGRRYYRPDDVVLLRRIADLLYIQGYTIKGVQRLLKEGGGALHDEIPPASAEERAAAAAERAQTSSLAASAIPSRPDLPELPITHATPPPQSHIPVPQPAASPAIPSDSAPLDRAHQVNAVLRTALQTVLSELETLRASLLD
ncbi:MAG: MerR family transcriptional regulator [Acidiphilium sp.]|nr:MerR family transcriptional regulator [Acidiphilium sp.]MDD4935453.1 MerR family transcriptional regulator [Acidiphilium sp.]